MDDLGKLMVDHKISVWLDPNWWNGAGTPQWLAGQNISIETGQYYSTLTGSDPSTIVADNTASGKTPFEAVTNCIKGLLRG